MKYDQLQAYFVEAVKDIRQRLGRADIGSFRFECEAVGRTLTGDAKILYRVTEEYGANPVEGHDIAKVMEEFLRRHGWDDANAPLCLPAAGDLSKSAAKRPRAINDDRESNR